MENLITTTRTTTTLVALGDPFPGAKIRRNDSVLREDHGDLERRLCNGAITSKIKHAIKLKTSPARLAQLLQPSKPVIGILF